MKKLQSQIETLFLSLGGTKAQAVIVPSQLPHLCDYQVNGCLSLSKSLKKNPKVLAEEIVSQLSSEDANFSVAGPGFINIKLKDSYILKNLTLSVKSSEKICIDYSSPNVAKSMHVGHLRSTIIGSALVNMFKQSGAEVVGDNHLGDWGTPMGIVLSKIQLQQNFSWSLKEIEALYVQGSVEYKNDEQFKQLVQTNTHSLQLKKSPMFDLWKKLVDVTKDSLNEDYEALNVSFDLWEGESSFEPVIPEMMKELLENNLLEKSEGATVLPLSSGNPLVLEKASGGYLYATTDLACVKTRDGKYHKVLYVVDKRQSLHFAQVFEASKKVGFVNSELVHVSFGTINGADGKPFKTRSGEVLKLQELISQAKQKAYDKLKELNPSLSEDQTKSISDLVGVGALKFAELKHHRDSDYAFDLDKFVALEGFTGPYVMYNVVRAKSILKKSSKTGTVNVSHEQSAEERKLTILLSQSSQVMEKALSHYAPHLLCEHLFSLCQAFSAFYTVTPVLKELDSIKQAHYLALVESFKDQGEYFFKCLNISLPEEM